MNTAIRIATDYLTARTTGNVEDALAMASDDLILKTSMQATHGKAALRAALDTSLRSPEARSRSNSSPPQPVPTSAPPSS